MADWTSCTGSDGKEISSDQQNPPALPKSLIYVQCNPVIVYIRYSEQPHIMNKSQSPDFFLHFVKWFHSQYSVQNSRYSVQIPKFCKNLLRKLQSFWHFHLPNQLFNAQKFKVFKNLRRVLKTEFLLDYFWMQCFISGLQFSKSGQNARF